MSIQITSWLRAFFALQAGAMESRGFIELNAGEDDAVRWPRTIGADVIAIAALVGPFVRERRQQPLARRWVAAIADIDQFAATAPEAEYVANQSFWALLPSICVYLHAEHAELPAPEALTAVLEGLAARVALPELRHDHLFHAQYVYLRDKRGADPIPRTTNADVIQLAAFWQDALGKSTHVDGWRTLLADADALAKRGELDAEYTRNAELWSELERIARHLTRAAPAPRSAMQTALSGFAMPLLVAAGLVRFLLTTCGRV